GARHMLIDNPTVGDPSTASFSTEDEGRFQRVRVSVLGRYMLADRREFPCQIVEMSPGDAMVIAPVSGNVGERVIIYLDHLGRVEGNIFALSEGGFRMDLVASPLYSD